MKRTISVLLPGVGFQIEEGAYDRLDGYLSAVRRGFTHLPDAEEVMRDIEARIAERLAARTDGGAVVTVADVNALIAVMGDPEELRDVSGGRPAAWSGPTATRGLYRNLDDRILGGVCSGLASYFGLDTVWVRAAFAATLLTVPFGNLGYVSATALAGYAVLWFLVAPATTPAQKMQMRSEAIGLKPLGTMASKRLDVLRSTDWSTLRRRRVRDPFRIIANALLSTGRGTGGMLLRALSRTIGVMLVAAGAAGTVLTAAIALALLTDNVPSFVGFYGDHVIPFRDVYGPSFAALTLVGFVAALVLLAFMMLAGLSMARLPRGSR